VSALAGKAFSNDTIVRQVGEHPAPKAIVVDRSQHERPHFELSLQLQRRDYCVGVVARAPDDGFGGKYVQEHLVAEAHPITTRA
jgi:hypothetical protein